MKAQLTTSINTRMIFIGLIVICVILSFSSFTYATGFLLKNYTLTLKENSTVIISWEQPDNTSGWDYVVEKSHEGVDFEELTFIKEPINTTSVTDEAPFEGYCFYRIKRISRNGDEEYSEIKTIKTPVTEKQSLVVYPNPVNGEAVNLHMPSTKSAEIEITIYNMAGYAVKSEKRMLSEGLGRVDLSDNFQSGKYIIKVIDKNNKVQMTRFEVVR